MKPTRATETSKTEPLPVSEWDFLPKAENEVPPGWKNIHELSEERKISGSQMRALMRLFVKNGRVEMRRFRKPTGGAPVPYYKPVQAGKG